MILRLLFIDTPPHICSTRAGVNIFCSWSSWSYPRFSESGTGFYYRCSIKICLIESSRYDPRPISEGGEPEGGDLSPLKDPNLPISCHTARPHKVTWSTCRVSFLTPCLHGVCGRGVRSGRSRAVMAGALARPFGSWNRDCPVEAQGTDSACRRGGVGSPRAPTLWDPGCAPGGGGLGEACCCLWVGWRGCARLGLTQGHCVKGTSEHFLFPCDSIAAPKAPSVGTSLRA